MFKQDRDKITTLEAPSMEVNEGQGKKKEINRSLHFRGNIEHFNTIL